MIRLLLVAYAGLGGALAADGRAWLAAPLCLAALHSIGELWIRALPGVPPETGLPAVRAGLAAVTGLVTLPLVALLLHLAGLQVRPVPLAAGTATTATLLGAAILLRTHLSGRRAAGRAPLPSQRNHAAPESSDADTFSDPSAGSSPEGAGHPSAEGASTAGGSNPDSRYARTAAIVGVPVMIAVTVGVLAVRAYLTAPHPAEPGYLSVALNGWAAAIDRPVTVPARGLTVPVRVTSAGLADITTLLKLRVGGQIVASKPLTVAADTVRSLSVHVPALPPDGCLRAIDISVGATSAGFYARGPRTAARPPSGARGGVPARPALTGPGVHSPATAGDAAPGTGSAGTRVVPGERPAGSVGTRVVPGERPAGSVGTRVVPGERPAGSVGTRVVPGKRPAGATGTGAVPGKRPANDAGAGAAPGKRPASSVRTPGERPAGTRAVPGKRPAGSAGTRVVPGKRPANHVGAGVAPGKRPVGAGAAPGERPAGSTGTGVVPGKQPAGTGAVPGKKRPGAHVGATGEKRPGVNGRFVDPGPVGAATAGVTGGGNASGAPAGAARGPAPAGQIRAGVPGRFADPGPVGTGGMGGGMAEPAGAGNARRGAPTLERAAC